MTISGREFPPDNSTAAKSMAHDNNRTMQKILFMFYLLDFG
jgi:hypothetical protein